MYFCSQFLIALFIKKAIYIAENYPKVMTYYQITSENHEIDL